MEEFLIDVWSFKRWIVGETMQVFSNRYVFNSPIGWSTAGAVNALAAVRGAENHMFLTDVALTLLVAAPTGLIPSLNWDTPAMSFARSGDFGGRSLLSGSAALDPEYALVLDQQTLSGRAGNLYMRGVLQEHDVVFAPGGVVLLKEKQWPENRPTEMFNDRIFAAEWTPCVVRRDPLTLAAIEPRSVYEYSWADAVKMRSISDAQRRKTLIALEYKRMAEMLPDQQCLLDYYIWELLRDYPDKLPREQFLNVGLMAGNLGTALKDVAVYWTKGLQPSVALEWRPGSGLDPHTFRANSWCAAAIDSTAEIMKRVGDVVEASGDEIDSLHLLPIRSRVWGIGLAIAQTLSLCRFTGTPIPHNIV